MIRGFYCEPDSIGLRGCNLEEAPGLSIVVSEDSGFASAETQQPLSCWLHISDGASLGTFVVADGAAEFRPSENQRNSVSAS